MQAWCAGRSESQTELHNNRPTSIVSFTHSLYTSAIADCRPTSHMRRLLSIVSAGSIGVNILTACSVRNIISFAPSRSRTCLYRQPSWRYTSPRVCSLSLVHNTWTQHNWTAVHAVNSRDVSRPLDYRCSELSDLILLQCVANRYKFRPRRWRARLSTWPINAWRNRVDLFRCGQSNQFSLCAVNELLVNTTTLCTASSARQRLVHVRVFMQFVRRVESLMRTYSVQAAAKISFDFSLCTQFPRHFTLYSLFQHDCFCL